MHGRLCACARGATAADAEGRRRLVRLPPTSGGVRTPQAGRQRRPTDGLLLLHACSGRRYVYHLKTPRLDQQVRPPPLPCLAPSRHPAHLRTAPPCCPPALAIQTWGSGAIRDAAQGGSVYGGLCGRACGERGGSRCQKGGGGRVGQFFCFFLPVQCLTPPVCAFCVSRGCDGCGGGGIGPSTVSTRVLVAAGSAASGGGAGGGAPCALRPVLLPPGAPRGSQAPRAAWACARHAPRILGGVGAY